MRKGAFIFLVLGASFFIPTVSHGAVIISQGDYASATTTGATGASYQQTLGTGITGTINTMSFIVDRENASTHAVTFSLCASDFSTYASCGEVDNDTFLSSL